MSLSEKIDTTTAAGKMVFRMLAVLAEFERDQISERTAVVMQHKKSKGERVGAIPYGYQLKGDGITLVECQEEQAVITQAKSLHTAGLSLRKIADELDTRGLHARNGAKFQSTQILRMVA